MKVLLVQAHLGRKEGPAPVFPLGLCYLAAALAGHAVRLLDLNVWELDEARARLKQALQDFQPEVAGLSIRNIDTTQRGDSFYYFKTVAPTARLIKATLPRVNLVAGGPGFSMFAGPILERIPEFNVGVMLEGEESFPELLQHLDHPEQVRGLYLRRDGRVLCTGARPLPDFGRLPIPRREPPLIALRPYLPGDGSNIGLQSKRGCAEACAYCSYPWLSGSRSRLRAPAQVVDEIEYLQRLGASRFSFVDNVFNQPPAHARDICAEIIRRGLRVEWSAWFEIGDTTEDLVRLARQAGCVHIGFSPDAASAAGLDRLQKGITTRDIDRSVRIVGRCRGLKAGYNFFILPDMRWQELWQTFSYFVRIPWLLRGRGRVFGLGWIRIEPETLIHRQAIAEGILRPDTELLPADEQGLSGLFYCRPSTRRRDALILRVFRGIEGGLKPALKAWLRKLRPWRT